MIMIDDMFRSEDNIIDTVNGHIGLQKNALLLIFHQIFCLIHHQTRTQILFLSERLKYWMCSWKRHRIYCFFSSSQQMFDKNLLQEKGQESWTWLFSFQRLRQERSVVRWAWHWFTSTFYFFFTFYFFLSTFPSSKPLNIRAADVISYFLEYLASRNSRRWLWRRSCWTEWEMKVPSFNVTLVILHRKTSIMRSWRQRCWSTTRGKWAAMWRRWGNASVKSLWKN